jgi:site-specific DNA-cytosine methylase
MKKGLTVLSLFDGMSCGRLAFDRANIAVKKYYASEIDKYAEKISAYNYPDIIRLGDVTKWREWQIDQPDIIIAGSPCQGFSIAGKKLNFNDPRSALFFTFVDILKHYKPKYFLLENVRMKKEWRDKITELVGVEPIEINSALVSAQNRKRLYWTNIPSVTQPKDKGIFLKDIIENADTEKLKAYCIDANYAKGANHKQYSEKCRRQLVKNSRTAEDKALAVTTNANTTGSGVTILIGHAASIKGHDYNRRIYSAEGKSPSLCGASGGNLEPKISQDSVMWRKLTPLECERLQTVPDNYTDHVSNSQRYKMLGNGWTVDVIAHIFRGLK